jgi:hypothetical protein
MIALTYVVSGEARQIHQKEGATCALALPSVLYRRQLD